MTSTIGATLAYSHRTLAERGRGESRLEAELLLCVALDMNRTSLYTVLDDAFPEQSQGCLDSLLERRLRREPLAYIMGHREFYGLEFKVCPGVLVPRPETELLVDEAIQIVKERFPEGDAAVVDVGTGSGAVAVSLAVRLPQAQIYAVDVSPAAVCVAATNAQAHHVQDRVVLLQGDLLMPLPARVDLIVANLPYIPTDRLPTLAPEINLYEPKEALDGGPDGLDLVRRLLGQSSRYLKPGGAVLLEMDPDQMDSAIRSALRVYPGAGIRRLKDLAGHDRALAIMPVEQGDKRR